MSACSHDLETSVSMRSRTLQGRDMNCSTCLQGRSRTLSISPFQMIPQLRPASDSQYCSDLGLSRVTLPAVMIRATACCCGSLWLFIKSKSKSIWETCRQEIVQRQGPMNSSRASIYVPRSSAFRLTTLLSYRNCAAFCRPNQATRCFDLSQNSRSHPQSPLLRHVRPTIFPAAFPLPTVGIARETSNLLLLHHWILRAVVHSYCASNPEVLQ